MLRCTYSLMREDEFERQKPPVHVHDLALACSFHTLHSGKNSNVYGNRASSPPNPPPRAPS